jgi:hypothetical protein
VIFSFARGSEHGNVEIDAFPAELAERVKGTVSMLARGQMHTPSDTVISVHIAGELLSIPYRVYYDKQQLADCMSRPGEAALIAICLATRHYDGYVREQCVRRLLEVDERWVAPYVIQLLGEYVIEIVRPIHERFLEGIEPKYVDFFRENAKYCDLECRAISYWNEYYRSRFPSYKDYPGVKALEALRLAKRTK